MLIKLLYYLLGVFLLLFPFLFGYSLYVILKQLSEKSKKYDNKANIISICIPIIIGIGMGVMCHNSGIGLLSNVHKAEINFNSVNELMMPLENENVNNNEDIMININGFERGIDVSKYQEDINWKLVAKDNIDYAMIRLGYRGYETGKINYDSYFKKNMKGALSNGIKVGCYFGSTAISKSEIKAEVEFILKNVKNYNITMPLAIAWRQDKSPDSRVAGISNDKAKDLLNYYCKLITDAGYKPLIYLTKDWLDDLEYNFDYPLWINTNGKTEKPNVSNLMIWQYTDSGKVSGISGKADLNYCYE